MAPPSSAWPLLLRDEARCPGQQRHAILKSRAMVLRLELTAKLDAHEGCVNTLSWSEDGRFCVSGSDDCRLVIWNIRQLKAHSVVQTVHSGNIFSAQFVPGTNSSEIVSCAADGELLHHQLGEAGAGRGGSGVTLHSAPHFLLKIAFQPQSPKVFAVTGRDVLMGDLRSRDVWPLVTFDSFAGGFAGGLAALLASLASTSRSSTGLAWDPHSPTTLAVGVDDPFVRLYDVRMVRGPEAAGARRQMAAEVQRLRGPPLSRVHGCGVSSLEFSRERPGLLLANYRDSDVFLFDSARAHGGGAAAAAERAVVRVGEGAGAYEGAEAAAAVRVDEDADNSGGNSGGVGGGGGSSSAPADASSDSHSDEDSQSNDGDEAPVVACPTTVLRGRRNVETFAKDAAFVLGDQWVATGGDCGNLYLWNVDTGELVRRATADRCVVNCVAAHPSLPVLAVSGIDSDVKVFECGRVDRPVAPRPSKRARVNSDAGSVRDAPGPTGERQAGSNDDDEGAAADPTGDDGNNDSDNDDNDDDGDDADDADSDSETDDSDGFDIGYGAAHHEFDDVMPWTSQPRSFRERMMFNPPVLTVAEALERVGAAEDRMRAAGERAAAGDHAAAYELLREAIKELRFGETDTAIDAHRRDVELVALQRLALASLELRRWDTATGAARALASRVNAGPAAAAVTRSATALAMNAASDSVDRARIDALAEALRGALGPGGGGAGAGGAAAEASSGASGGAGAAEAADSDGP